MCLDKQQSSQNGKLSSIKSEPILATLEQAKSRGPLPPPPPRALERTPTLLDLVSEPGARPPGGGPLADYGPLPNTSRQIMPLDTTRLFKLRYSPLKAHGSQHSHSKSQNGLQNGSQESSRANSSSVESVKVQSVPLVQLPPAVTFDSSTFAEPRRVGATAKSQSQSQSQLQVAQLQAQSQGRAGVAGRQPASGPVDLSGGGSTLFSIARSPVSSSTPIGSPVTLKLSHSATNLSAAEQPTRLQYSKLWPYGEDSNLATKQKHRLSLRSVNEVLYILCYNY